MTSKQSGLRVPAIDHGGLLLLVTMALFFALAVGARPAVANEHRKQITLSVEGMVCPLCENTVESVLTGLDGVDDARADRSTESAVVIYDPRDVSPAALVKSVNEETYYEASLASSFSDVAPPSSKGDGVPAYFWFLVAAVVFGAWFTLRRVRGVAAPSDPAPDPVRSLEEN